ncbi:hypothetical protein C8N46_1141 [Kordia periserrulae]|uniref:Uncharacterized protein n=1 Tax=Kordia periserrulae TaxID=701523 RepID=A0A2T6BQN5_9FLAO|nr:hypothetical protein [Kordia periserrulae]PTX58356.1 hypothetical protein C8N46_1141 [Kordia periserrulae]
MKKRNLISLQLNKKSISNLQYEKVVGGATYPCSTGPGVTSVRPYYCKVMCEFPHTADPENCPA